MTIGTLPKKFSGPKKPKVMKSIVPNIKILDKVGKKLKFGRP